MNPLELVLLIHHSTKLNPQFTQSGLEYLKLKTLKDKIFKEQYKILFDSILSNQKQNNKDSLIKAEKEIGQNVRNFANTRLTNYALPKPRAKKCVTKRSTRRKTKKSESRKSICIDEMNFEEESISSKMVLFKPIQSSVEYKEK